MEDLCGTAKDTSIGDDGGRLVGKSCYRGLEYSRVVNDVVAVA
jgi:hypothetical protein